MEYERKQKIKKGVLIGYISITTIFTIFMIIMLAIAGVSSKKKQKASAYVQDSYYVAETYKSKVQPKYASYNDEDYSITLTADELNNYTWYNFYTYISSSQNITMEDIPLNYDDNTYTFYTDDFDGSIMWDYNETYSIFLIYSEDFNTSQGTTYKTYQFGFDNNTQFTSSLRIDFDNFISSWNDIKSAVQLDIQANEKSINDGIFETLTSGIVAFIGSISAGINGMISVFWADDSLTVIGTLSVIVVAVSLAYFLFRLIIGLIRMRG